MIRTHLLGENTSGLVVSPCLIRPPSKPSGRQSKCFQSSNLALLIQVYHKPCRTFEGEISYVECEEKFNTTTKCSARYANRES